MIDSSDIKSVIFIVFILVHQFSFAQVLTGKVTTTNEEPLPFATIYVAGTSIGTNTNAEGVYSLELPLGTHEVVFQYIGYKKVKKTIQSSENIHNYNIRLSPEVFQLEEVVVNANQKDPAYEIILKAIENRKKHKEEIESYTCQVYIKGLQRLDKRPSKLLGYTIPIDTGIIYLSESIANIEVRQPNKVKETMVSSRVSGNSSGFSFNQASQTLISFYNNLIEVDGLTERGFISPIAKNALFFYKYQLVSTISENNTVINKIKVIPRRKTDPTFEGYIYIVEDQWSISSLDLTLTKDHQIELLDQIRIKQVFAPVEPNIWLMITQHFDFNVNVWGFEGTGYFNVNYMDYKYSLNQKYHPIKKTNLAGDRKNSSNTQQRFFSKRQTPSTNEILKIQEGANKRSDIYWAKHRPVPLTTIEQRDYHTKDSLALIMQSKNHRGSLDKKNNKLTLSKVFYVGYRHQNSLNETSWEINPITNSIQYNTVEGGVLNFGGNYSIRDEKILKHRIEPQIRYGFASRKLYGKVGHIWYYDNIKKSKLSLYGGSFISQINRENPILPLVNTLETLVNRQNFIKLYEKQYFTINHESEIRNGIHLKTSIEYAKRSPLFNQTTYSIFHQDHREFSVNNPINIEKSNTVFEKHNALVLTARLTFRINQKYISGPDMKYNLGSKYPDLVLYYRGGINRLGTNIRYDLVELKIKDSFKLCLIGEGKYILSTGSMISQSNFTFIDYKHFNSNQSVYSRFALDQFQLLDYYQYSTSKPWIEAHYTHHFNGFVVNKLPLIKKTKVQTVASLRYLKTQSLHNYLEISMGLEHIFKIGRFDYTLSIVKDQHHLHGIRFGLGF